MGTKNAEFTLEHIEQVADMVWLLNKIETLKIKENFKEKELESKPLKSDTKPEIEIPQDKSKNNSANKPLPKKEEVASIYENDVSTTKTDIKADPIRMPKKLALSNYRAWEKSFKSFYYKVDSTTEFVLDEAKTVDIIAKTKLVQPIFKAKKVKYFYLTMVIEQSPSMDIWDELILEYQKTVQRFGVFQGIDFYYLASTSNSVHLYADRALKREIDPKKLNLNSQTLLTIVSDCVSSAWHSNHIFKMLEFWANSVPVSITQMFPKRMWKGTALYKGFQTSFTSHNFKQLNKKLVSNDGYFNNKDSTFNLPIVNFEPQSIKAWSSVIHGKRGKWIDGIILEDLKTLAFIEINGSQKSISTEERVQRYLSQASPLAQELARYASVLPISFHVIRVLQELKLPKSSQVHLAEFFLGGLIKREINEEGKVSFDFHFGVRDYFRNQLTATTAYRLQESMSSFVSQNLNSSLDFQALIDNPNSTSGLYLSKDEIAFVKLRADTLRQLGGDYGREADILLNGLIFSRELKDEFLNKYMPLKKLTKKNGELSSYSKMFDNSFRLKDILYDKFSKKYTKEVIEKVLVEITKEYGEIGWIKVLKNNKILWVDDQPRNNTHIKKKFENIGLDVRLALSTNEALELLKGNTYLTIISDMGRREGPNEGYVLLEALRKLGDNTPFLIFANSSTFKHKKMVVDRGGQGTTSKINELARMVMNIIDGKEVELLPNMVFDNSPSILAIESKEEDNKNFGTGFIIYQDTYGSYVLTCTHILEAVIEPVIQGYDVEVRFKSSSETLDLAILHVKGLFETVLEFQDKDLSSREVKFIGYQSYGDNNYQAIGVNARIFGDKVTIGTNKDIAYKIWHILSKSKYSLGKGEMGAPLISQESGKVLGILTKRRGREGYAVSIEYIKDILDKSSELPFKNLNSFELASSHLFFGKGHMHNSVVKIGSKEEENSSFGMGFVIHQDASGSYVLTMDYVLSKVVIPIVENYETKIKFRAENKLFACAVLYVKGLFSKAFEFQDKDFTSREVEFISFSSFFKKQYLKEVVEATIVDDNMMVLDSKKSLYPMWHIITKNNYEINSGSMGSPLISKESGKVIGIMTNRKGNKEGYVLSVEYLKDILDESIGLLFKEVESFKLKSSNPSYIKEFINDSVVLIQSKENNQSFGTGFVIHQDNKGSYILTSSRMIEKENEFMIDKIDIKVIASGSDKGIDLAVVYVEKIFASSFHLSTLSCKSNIIEFRGYSAFTKEHFMIKTQQALLLNNKVTIQNIEHYEIKLVEEASLENGMTGSPLFCPISGDVIGIISLKKGSKVGYALPIENLSKVWTDMPSSLLHSKETNQYKG